MSHPYISNQKNLKPKAKLLPIPTYFRVNLKRFLLETSLNGLKYVYDGERNIFERAYYLISFATVFISGIYMCLYFLQKWQSTPVIVSLSSETTSIQDIPFPTVTFCNMNQVLKSKVDKYPIDSPDYALLQKICFQDYNFTSYRNFTPRFPNDTFSNFIIKNSQPCEKMIIYCKFGPTEETCSDLFREVLLDEGLCCVFNQMHPFFLYKAEYKFIRDYTSSNGRTTIPVNWNIEQGYKKPLPGNVYPRPAAGSGVSMGLTVVLNADLNDYYCTSTNGPGFKMLLYNAIDSTHMKQSGLPIILGHQTRVRINAKRIESTHSLRQTTPRDRQCYFAFEKKLLYFKYYTRRNCEMECDSNWFLRLCNCIPYYMPLIQANASVCFLKDMDCVNLAERLIVDSATMACKEQCLSGCDELRFFPDLFLTPFSMRNYTLQDKFFRNISNEVMEQDLAQVHFYYQENFFRGRTRSPYTGFTEFLSQTGGALSLMVGFSVISIAEVFYFSLMKPFFDMLLRRSPYRLSGTDELEENVIQVQDTSFDKHHHRFIIKGRKPIRNRVMVWNKDDLKQYREKQRESVGGSIY